MSTQPTDPTDRDTGERMSAESADANTFWEHIYRYRFAAGFVRSKRVLDIACGTGYGTAALLQAGASTVLGVDISPEVCERASRRFGIETRVGSAEQIPLPAQSVDVVVSFETIEHVADPAAFVRECRRVLVPGGRIVISTPNRDIYRQIAPHNPFHVSELANDEFVRLISRDFDCIDYYVQRFLHAPAFSLIGLAADDWPARRIPGVGRLNHWLRRRGRVPATDDVPAAFRANPVSAVFAELDEAKSLADPYALRPKTRSNEAHCVYLVATGLSR